MFLRRDRIHLQGRSNKQNISQADEAAQTFYESRIHKLSTPKNKNFSQILSSRIKRTATAKSPLEESQTFYKTQDRKIFQKFNTGSQRTAELQQNQFGKKVFFGDSDVVLNENLNKDRSVSPKRDEVFRQKLAFTKHETHSRAFQETQLVGLEKNKVTLAGRVDIEKVKEIRRALRRRYGNRKNFQHIFNAWDEDSNGAISVQNLHSMLNRLGINANVDEARVILASSDKDGSHDLNLEEFLDLILNESDALNVDLAKLNALTEAEEQDIMRKSSNNRDTLNYLQENAKKNEQIRRQNQVSQILKNKIQQISQLLTQADESQKGTFQYPRFNNIMKKLQLDPKFLSDDDLKNIFDKFKRSDDHIEYTQFLDYLSNFNLTEDNQLTDQVSKIRSQSLEHLNQKQKMIHEIKNRKTEAPETQILDCTKVDSWKLERSRLKSQKIFNILKRYTPSKADFKNLIQQQLPLECVGRCNQNQIKKFLENFLNSVNETVTKYEMDSLVSQLQFGTYNTISIEEICRVVFDEDDDQFFERAQQRKKDAPPPVEIARAKELDYQKIYLNNWTQDNLEQILQKVDENVFRSSEKAYKLYKQFDSDQDGYISHQDMYRRLKQMNFLNDQEIGTIIRHVDPDNKGYSNFSEFHQKMRAGINISDNQGNLIKYSSIQPCKAQVLILKKQLPELRKNIEENKLAFKPELNQKINQNTRFGSTPAHQNTFINFQAHPNSAMYATAQERFYRNDDINQNQIKQFKKNQIQSAKIMKIQQYETALKQRIEEKNVKLENRDISKLRTKALAQWAYDHQAHLQNDFKQ